MDSPMAYSAPFVHAVEANYRDYLNPNEARRMAPIMKRALVSALKALQNANIEQPDAIITGTALGSLSYTNKFLKTLTEDNEQFLKPTYFMQSTHNTIGSTLGIYTKTHGYNTTFSHGGISFEVALRDAFVLAKLRKASTILVGGYDEMDESYFQLLRKTGYVGLEGMCPCGEVAVSMVLNTVETKDCLCELAGLTVAHTLDFERIKDLLQGLLNGSSTRLSDIDAVMMGTNGKPENDRFYDALARDEFADKPLLRYKNVFGENYTAPALAVYAAAHCLKKGTIPAFMIYANKPKEAFRPSNILIINRSDEQDVSLILLRKSCC